MEAIMLRNNREAFHIFLPPPDIVSLPDIPYMPEQTKIAHQPAANGRPAVTGRPYRPMQREVKMAAILQRFTSGEYGIVVFGGVSYSTLLDHERIKYVISHFGFGSLCTFAYRGLPVLGFPKDAGPFAIVSALV
jgi:hypothetical protein